MQCYEEPTSHVSAASASTCAAKPECKLKPLKFNLHFASRPGQQVIVTGSCDALGSWDLQAGLHLTWQDGHIWSNPQRVMVQGGEEVEYKYVVESQQPQQVLWCQGQNLVARVPASGDAWVIRDTWSPSTNEVIQEGVAEEACLDASSHPANEPFEPYPVEVPYQCFLCGQCMLPHLHYRHCPRGYSASDAQRVFVREMAGRRVSGLATALEAAAAAAVEGYGADCEGDPEDAAEACGSGSDDGSDDDDA